MISISVFLCLHKEETDIERYNLLNNLTVKSGSQKVIILIFNIYEKKRTDIDN
jgi:hypothetical protein